MVQIHMYNNCAPFPGNENEIPLNGKQLICNGLCVIIISVFRHFLRKTSTISMRKINELVSMEFPTPKISLWCDAFHRK